MRNFDRGSLNFVCENAAKQYICGICLEIMHKPFDIGIYVYILQSFFILILLKEINGIK